jgi:hypothetical protein
MAHGNTKKRGDKILLPRPSSAALRGRQSVRATFKLSARAIETISIVASHMGIKQKSLFDHLIEDIEVLQQIARDMQPRRFDRLRRVQKTYVLSRRALSSLDETSRHFETPRDALVEYSVQRLMPVIARERERHRRRKAILTEVQALTGDGGRLMEKAQELLGVEDPVYESLGAALTALSNARHQIEAMVEKGRMIEEFDEV